MGTRGLTMLKPLWQGLPPGDPMTLSGSASCPLQPRYESVRGARQFTRETLRSWDLDELFDGVALVVSELVTNALRHADTAGAGADGGTGGRTGGAGAACGEAGAGAGEAGTAGGEAPAARLHLMRWSSRLICAVRDSSDASPVAAEADDTAESGRGLHLVDSFSDSWGWHPLAGEPHGKVVWALFRLP
ncbi:ATP-binding protein [Streptomyces sp. MST-110588]|uniref:ATP-binding protein n=1 Tax=Streptomyces sp. MST-110588 TaxID=2833628 RepID=UPI001F5DCB69|nr:ATP-binding protein [Streptomyces sp. MST-110588]UNO40642.1 ATP-binding protein [Streptomyces sp. MST-110588]